MKTATYVCIVLVYAVTTVLHAQTNVLLICVDDLKPALRCYGDALSLSPNIDRLAKRGVLFERAYCNQAVCAPSRNALLTGVRPTTMGIYDLGTNFRLGLSNAVTLPQHFKNAGYRTEGLGKIFHVGHGNVEDPASWSVPHWPAAVIAYAKTNYATSPLTREEALFENKAGFETVRGLPRGKAYESPDVPDEAYPDGRLAQEAIARLRQAATRTNQPFFLAVGFVKPHLPFCAPQKYWDMYDSNRFALPELRKPPEGAPKFAPQFGGELRQYAGIPEEGPIPDELARRLIHGYYASLTFMDAQLGKLLDELDALKLTDKTIVVMWGDHGWHLGDHGMWCKHTNYEQATRIPLIVAAPGIKPARTKALVETVDLYPTICELAGLKPPREAQKLEGASITSILRQERPSTKDAVYHVYPRNNRELGGPILGRAVRTEQYRLVEWKKPGNPPEHAELELYDYTSDPAETKNLAKEKPEIVSQLRAKLAELGEAKPQVPKAAQQNRPRQ